MARYSFAVATQATVAVADATNLTNLKYGCIQGVAAQQIRVNEIQIGGENTAAAVIAYAFGRDSTAGATLVLTSGYVAVTDATSAGAPAAPSVFTSATTLPQRSSTLGHLIHHSLQAYGGIARWQARQGEEITIFGASAALGECSYSGYGNCTTNASGVGVSYHILFESV